LFFLSRPLSWDVATGSQRSSGLEDPEGLQSNLLPKPGSSAVGWADQGLAHLVLQHNYIRKQLQDLRSKGL